MMKIFHLTKLNVTDGRWKYRKKDDVDVVDSNFVFYDPVKSTSISKAGYYFGEDNEKGTWCI